MSNDQKILQALANYFEENPHSYFPDTGIAEMFKYDIDEAQLCMQELSKQGYIELIDVTDLTGEHWIISSLTPKGRVTAKSIK